MIDKSIRNVIALYQEEPDLGLAEYKETKPWMDYLREKERPSIQDKSIYKVLKHVQKQDEKEAPEQGDGSEGAIYNLIDFKDPSGESKDQKGGPSAVYKYPSAPDDSGHFDKPQVFKDERSSLKEWMKVREDDFTSRPEEQYPAMSLDNKLASLEYLNPKDKKTYYHGTSDKIVNIKNFRLLPPKVTGVISEWGRKKNLDRVFFTEDLNSAKIYARKAVIKFGGNPIVVRVVPMGDIKLINDEQGTTVYSSPWAFFERLDNKLASSVSSVISRYFLQLNPMTIEGGISKTAASLREVRRNNTTPNVSKLDMKARRCTVNHIRRDPNAIKRGYVEFNVTDSAGSGDTKTVAFQFLKKPAGKGTKPINFLDYDVELACNCESFLWYGARYYAVKDKYMYMPMFNASPPPPPNHVKKLAPPNPTTVIVNTGSGKGLNFRMCKHVLAAMYYLIGKENLDEFMKADEKGEVGPTNWKTTRYYKNYPHVGPPSKVINVDKWKDFFKFDFTLDNLKKEIKKIRPKIPTFFKPSPYLTKVDNWIKNVWLNLEYLEKMSVLEYYVVEHPEQIYYILLKDALYNKGNVPDVLIDKAYEIMLKTLKPEGGEPEGEEPTSPEEGTGITGVLPEDKEQIKEKEEKDKFKPITPTQVTSPTGPTSPTDIGPGVPSEAENQILDQDNI